MSYKEHLYKNALTEIEKIYTRSKYDPNEDLYRSYDIMNSVNDAQLNSKEWLVENLLPFLTNKKYLQDTDGNLNDILIMGSWYGVTGIILKDYLNEDVKIHNVDFDPLCEEYCHLLMNGNERCKNVWPITDDAIDYYLQSPDAFQCIINTSCEHMEKEDIQMILVNKPFNTLVCFQSNNYHEEAEHINTQNSLEEFEEQLNLNQVYWKGELKPSEEYTRYMVIGR